MEVHHYWKTRKWLSTDFLFSSELNFRWRTTAIFLFELILTVNHRQQVAYKIGSLKSTVEYSPIECVASLLIADEINNTF